MTSPPDPDPGGPLPQPRVRRRWHRLRPVWIVPIVALVLTGWLGWRTLSQRGPEITITFLNAQGVEAGRTRIQRNSLDLGIVEQVDPSPDLSHAIVRVRMSHIAEPHLRTGTLFWIVKPRLSLGGISGLSTLVSGAYIEMEPGGGDPAREFTGLENPPVIQTGVPGRRFILTADQLGSISQGSPVYFRGVQVGEVVGSRLLDEELKVNVDVFVRAPHDQLVRPSTRFWNATGIQISAGAEGIRATTESLQALLQGGVAFDTSPDALAGEPSPDGAVFPMQADAASAREAEPPVKRPFVVNLPGPVRGLQAGAPVELKGMRIGKVTSVHLEYDVTGDRLRTPVTLDLFPTMLEVRDAPPGFDIRKDETLDGIMGKLIGQGLRAQLGTGNLLTGQRLISLDFVPGMPPAMLGHDGPVPELPAAPAGDLEGATRSASIVLDKVAALPLSDLVEDLRGTVRGVGTLVSGPQIQDVLVRLDHVLANLDGVTRTAGTQLGPTLETLQATLKQLRTTLDTANGLLGGSAYSNRQLPDALKDVQNAAKSIQSLADYLERHPDALLRGKRGYE